jgi:hypothetical protein
MSKIAHIELYHTGISFPATFELAWTSVYPIKNVLQ